MSDQSQPARLRDPLRPCRAGARPDDRRGDDADLRHVDLRAAEPGRAQGLRLCAHQESDPHGVRALHRRSRGRHARGFAFASGLAAISTTLECLDHGSHIVAVDDLYGGSRRLFERVRKRSAGLEIDAISISPMPERLEAAIRPNTRLVWIETPTNPLLKLVDLERVAAIARRARHAGRPPTTLLPVLISSTRSSTASISWCIRPPNISTAIPTWWAAWRWSATMRSSRERMTFLQNAVGAIQGPFEFVPRAARAEDACACGWSATAPLRCGSRRWLEASSEGARASIYPGLASHPQHALAKRQMRAFGGMISVELKASSTMPPLPRTLPAVRAGRKSRRRRKPDRASRADDAWLGAAPMCARARHRRHAGAALGRHRGADDLIADLAWRSG